LATDWAISAKLKSGWTNSPWFRRALAVIAGVLLALSFPKAGVAGFAWIAPGLLLLATKGGSGFRLGYLAGLAHYLVSLSWLLHIPVRFYPILGWLALAAYLALYPALWVWLCTRGQKSEVKNQSWLARTAHALFCAVAWVALEMIVARMFSGFPWNLLGASQYKLLPLIQIASVTGVYGLSFAVVWFSASLANAVTVFLHQPAHRRVWLNELALPIFTLAIVYACGLHRMKFDVTLARSLRIALVQPSIPQTMIWNRAESRTRFAELLRLTEAALTNKPDLVIWPEAAVPEMVREDPFTRATIVNLASNNQVWLIIGSDDYDMRGTNEIYFNSSFLVSPRGEFISTYRKRRLVIFGEYVPLVDWLPFVKYLTPISGGFTAGERPVVFDLAGLNARTSVLICFEDVFPHYAREHAGEEVDFLVNITNDGWFGESAAQWQQAASAAFRAVENNMPLVRCANNGVSCWIDPFGALHNVYFDDSSDVYRAGFKIVTVPQMKDGNAPRTFYNRHGDWFGWACVGIIGVAVAAQMIRRRNKTKK
jgi:apolipoprotein N-acyltransferase